MKNLKFKFVSLLLISFAVFTSCSDDDNGNTDDGGGQTANFVGAVYAMTNGNGQVDGTNIQGPNSIVAYGRNGDGTLNLIGSFLTQGNGGDYDGGEGLDPLISANAVIKTDDNEQLFAVNAGSNTVTSFNIQDDFSLVLAGTPQPTGAIGPNSIAYKSAPGDGVKGIIYVSDITRSEFLTLGEPQHQGTVTGFWVLTDGSLSPIAGSRRNLANRPSAIQFSPDGNWLVVTSINAGAVALGSGSEDELVVYNVSTDGTLSASQWGAATSTLRGNTEGRNLPSAIGFDIAPGNIVVVTEAREFQPDGTPPAFPALQDGSVSTWQIQADGSLTPMSLDVRTGEGNTGRTACWIGFTPDYSTFFVSNAIDAGIASFNFGGGNINLVDQFAGQGTGTNGADNGPDAFASTDGFIDLWISDDGAYLYQLYGLDGTIGIYRINGQNLEFVGEVSGDLPTTNTQGIVAI